MLKEEFDILKPGDLVYAEIVKFDEWHLCYIISKSETTAHVYTAVLCPQKNNTYWLQSAVTRSYEELQTLEKMTNIVKKEYNLCN